MLERGNLLRKVAARLRERAKELLDVEVADTGNTIGSLRVDVEYAAQGLEYYAGLGTEMKGEKTVRRATGCSRASASCSSTISLTPSPICTGCCAPAAAPISRPGRRPATGQHHRDL